MNKSCLFLAGMLLAGCGRADSSTQPSPVHPTQPANHSPAAPVSVVSTPPVAPGAVHPQPISVSSVTPGASVQSRSTEDRLFALRLHPEDFDEELTHTGRVVRSNSPGANATSAPMDDDALTSLISARLLADSDLTTSSIKVAVESGAVTLTGEVPSRNQLGRVMVIALDTPGVTRVISLLTVPVS